MNRGWIKPHIPSEDGPPSPWAVARPLLQYIRVASITYLIISALLLFRTYRSGDVDFPIAESDRAENRDNALIQLPLQIESLDRDVIFLNKESTGIDNEAARPVQNNGLQLLSLPPPSCPIVGPH